MSAGEKGANRRIRLLLMIFVLGSVSFEQAVDGLPHQLTASSDERFEQGLDVLVAGLEAM